MNTVSNSFALGIATFRSQVLGSFLTSASDSKGATTDFFSVAFPDQQPTAPTTNPATGLSATGRNMALFDPESAYKMMTVINGRDVTYKAQFSELSQMKSAVAQMQDAGKSLRDITLATGNDSIQSQLQGFVDKYNAWIQRFNPDMERNGLLTDTQAAQMSRRELDQSIDYLFFGAKDGLHGLGDLGLTTDPATQLASLDTAKLGTVLASNKQGVVDTVQEFGAHFAEAARQLNSTGNFIPKQLDNLGRAIHYIADNRTSLTAEFGTGDPAKPTGAVAAALAAYNQVYNS